MDLSRLPASFKVVRTDRELEMSMVDEALRQWGAQLVILPDGTPADVLTRELADADVLLMCYAKITRPMLQGATRLKAIVKYGVGIDAIDIDTARSCERMSVSGNATRTTPTAGWCTETAT